MLRTRKTVAITLALALAAPSTAFAQSAGDEQYSDPFQDVPAEENQGDQGGEAPAPAPTPEAPPPAEAPTTEAPATEVPTTEVPITPDATTGSAPTLARTGFPAAVVGLIGFLLLAGGFTLRRAA